MRFFISLAVSVLLIIVAAGVNGQESKYPAKLEYDRTLALPNGIAFESILTFLSQLETRRERADGLAMLQQKLKIDEGSADTLFSQLMLTRQVMEQEVQLAQSTHACSPGDAYDLMDQLYDVAEEIYNTHYTATSGELDELVGARLQNWIDDVKVNTVYTRFDFEKADQLTEKDLTNTLTTLCGESK